MYLKGGLSKTRSLAALKGLNHRLPNVWTEFKSQFPDPVLNQFDGVIDALHAFEELRYPESVLAKGMTCTVSIKHPSAPTSSSGAAATPPQYDLCLEDIDKLVAEIFRVASVSPAFFTGGTVPRGSGSARRMGRPR